MCSNVSQGKEEFMPTVGITNLSVAHKASNGTSIVFPDVCKTPAPPGGVVPIPYPNTATTALKSQQKRAGGIAVKVPSGVQATGYEPGTVGGSVSQKSSVEFVNYSFDVKIEGKNVARQEEMQLHNSLHQANARLQALRTRDPNEWQKVLTEYAVLASALYRTLYPDD
jgi:hypothetical protein